MKNKMFVAAVGVAFMVSAWAGAAVITLTNPGFEQPGYETEKDGDQTLWTNVPGWTAAGVISDEKRSGTADIPKSGSYSGKIAGWDGDDGILQLTGHTIAAGEEFTLTFWAQNAYGGDGGNEAVLYYDNPANVISNLEYTASGSFEEYTLTATATAGSVGGNIGIRFEAGNNFLLHDDVSLSVVPEPATLGMVGTAGLALLLLRRRFRS